MCDCVSKIDGELEEKGLRLEVGFTFSGVVFTPIRTEKIDPKNRKVKTTTILPTFCPFCGKEMLYKAKEQQDA